MSEEVTVTEAIQETEKEFEIFDFFDTLYELHSVQAKLLTIIERHLGTEGEYEDLYYAGLDNIITLQETIDELFPDEDEDETEEGAE